MAIEQQVVEKLRELPPEKQKEVLDFVDVLKEKNGDPKKPLRSLLGRGAGYSYGSLVFGKLQRIVSGCPDHG